jgi:hypothetical protein
MTRECPGFDGEWMACILQPGDCEFAPVEGEPERMLVTTEAAAPDPVTG